jgi:hypothetical protein
MKSSQFHILKQRHQKMIAEIVSLTSKISHKEDVVKNIVAACNKASKALVLQRKYIYKDLEDFDYNIEVNHKVPTPKEKGDDSLITETTILVHVNKMLKENEVIIAGKIVNEMTNKKLSDTKLYEHPAVDILEALLDIHAEASSEFETGEVIEHQLTEEDFDNNPDLNNAGLNVGDKVDVMKMDPPSEEDFEKLVEKIKEKFKDETKVDPPVEEAPAPEPAPEETHAPEKGFEEEHF